MSKTVFDFPNLGTQEQKEQELLNCLISSQVKLALEKALLLSDQKSAAGSYLAGRIYEAGEGGVERNIDKAKLYYEKSIDIFARKEAYYSLANLHWVGTADWCSVKAVFDFYNVVLNDIGDELYANYMLGRMYFFGQHVNKNYEKSKEYFNKGWNNGHILSLTFLALIEWHEKNYLLSLHLRLKALYYGIKIRITDGANDERLKGLPR